MSRGHVPTAEEASLLASIDVRIADEGGGALVGVPIGIEEHDEEHAVGAVRDIDADCLARCLAGMIDKQPVALIAPNLSHRTTAATWSASWTPVRSSKHARGPTTGRSGFPCWVSLKFLEES